MRLLVNQIKVRKEDIPPNGPKAANDNNSYRLLKESISDKGLLTPIFVQPKSHWLVSGYWRLAVCRDLGWKQVPVVFVKDAAEVLDKTGEDYDLGSVSDVE